MKNDIEKQIRDHLVERGWDTLRPSDLAKSICIEAAELLEVFQWSSMTLEETKADPRTLERLKAELADVFIYALDMAVLLDLDTTQIIADKIEKVKQKYPAELMKQQAASGAPGTDSVYQQIKQDHRRKHERA